MDRVNYKLAEAIDKNNSDESSAQSGYMKLLDEFENELDPEDIDTIREIVSDEQNHSAKLSAMKAKYTGILPTSDGLKNALSFLTKGEDKKVRYGIPVS